MDVDLMKRKKNSFMTRIMVHKNKALHRKTQKKNTRKGDPDITIHLPSSASTLL